MPNISKLSLQKLAWIRPDYTLEILLISLLIVPFLSIIDIFWMFSPNAYAEWNTIHTPVSIKLLKDILLIALLVTLLFKKRVYSSWSKVSFAIITVIMFFSVTKAFIIKVPIVVILSGIRWYLPIFLFPLFDQYQVTKKDLKPLYERYRLVILAALPLQLLQIFFSERWNITGGIAYSRASGFFSQPQPMSLFAIFFLIIVIEIVPEKSKKLNYLLTLVSIVLTKSAAGVLGIGFLFFTQTSIRLKVLVAIITISTIAAFPFITGRVDYWESPLTRLKVLTKVDLNHTHFGSYTNACNTIKKIVPQMTSCEVPDSFITSSIGNLGLVLGIILLMVLACTIYLSKKHYLLPIFLLFLISANLTEYFPLNFLFPFIVGLNWKKEENY